MNIQNKINAGLRLSGNLNNKLRIGILNMHTSADIQNQISAYNNSIITLQQKVFDRSNISFFFLDRTAREDYDFLNNEDGENFSISIPNRKFSKISKFTFIPILSFT